MNEQMNAHILMKWMSSCVNEWIHAHMNQIDKVINQPNEYQYINIWMNKWMHEMME